MSSKTVPSSLGIKQISSVKMSTELRQTAQHMFHVVLNSRFLFKVGFQKNLMRVYNTFS